MCLLSIIFCIKCILLLLKLLLGCDLCDIIYNAKKIREYNNNANKFSVRVAFFFN